MYNFMNFVQLFTRAHFRSVNFVFQCLSEPLATMFFGEPSKQLVSMIYLICLGVYSAYRPHKSLEVSGSGRLVVLGKKGSANVAAGGPGVSPGSLDSLPSPKRGVEGAQRRLSLIPLLLFSANLLATPANIVDAAVKNYMSTYKVPGVAVGLYLDGKTYFFNFGYEDPAHTKKITENTVFEIGSITKSFVAALLAIQIQKNKMHLDDSLSNFLNLPSHSDLGKITLKQLVAHTSGLPRKPPMKKSLITKQRVVEIMSDWRSPITSPHYRYSNLGYNLLGYALEASSGTPSYEKLIEDEITRPLKMDHTKVAYGKKMANYAQGYSKDGKRVPPVNNGIGAAGALRSTTSDMVEFIKANLGITGPEYLKKALQLTHKGFYKINSTTIQALSWQRIKKDEVEIIDKNGGVGGFSTWMGFDPVSKSGLVILTTRRNFHVTEFGRDLLEALLIASKK